MAFILVAVSSDGRLFNAIIRRSIVSQPFFHPFSSTRSIFSTLGLVRHCFFSAVSIRGVYTSVPTDRYGMKSGRRWEGERQFGWPLERADSFPPEFTRHRLTVKGITEIVFEIFLLLSFSPFSFSRVLKAFPPRGIFHAVVDHRVVAWQHRYVSKDIAGKLAKIRGNRMFLARKLRLPGAISGIPPDDCYSLRWEGVFQSFSTLSRYVFPGWFGDKGSLRIAVARIEDTRRRFVWRRGMRY